MPDLLRESCGCDGCRLDREEDRRPEERERAEYCFLCCDRHTPTWNMHTECEYDRCDLVHTPAQRRYFDYCDACGHCHGTPICVDCSECGETHATPECEPEESEVSSLIHSYNYRPDPRFLGQGPLYLGFELELGFPESGVYGVSDAAEAVHEIVDPYAYLKEDGSIDHGFELVSHPMSFAFATDRFPMEDMMASLRNNGAESSSGLGIHVHVSRAGFDSPSHVYRWLKLLYRNSQQVERIARRRNSHWAMFRPEERLLGKMYAKGWPHSYQMTMDEDQQIRASHRSQFGSQYYGSHRYSAVNCNTGHGTFEVRVFRSTTSTRKLMAAIGLCHSSIEYTRELTAADVCQRDGWQWSSFADWVADRPQYAPLYKEMEVRQCVS